MYVKSKAQLLHLERVFSTLSAQQRALLCRAKAQPKACFMHLCFLTLYLKVDGLQL